MPEFPGGVEELQKYLATNIEYPSDAHEQGKSGRVFVQFVVSKTGDVKDVKIIRSGGFESLDDEAIRVVSAMPKWTPGKQRGINVNVNYTVPINFVINDESDKSQLRQFSIKLQGENKVPVIKEVPTKETPKMEADADGVVVYQKGIKGTENKRRTGSQEIAGRPSFKLTIIAISFICPIISDWFC